MNIIIATQEYPPDNLGGIGTQTYIKAHELSKLGHKIYVICPSVSNARQEYKDKKVNVIRLVMENNFNNQVAEIIAYSTVLAKEIDKLSARIRIDIIDFPELWNQGYIYLLNRTKSNNIPCVIQIHSSLLALSKNLGWPERDTELYKVGTKLEAGSLRLADAIYSSSKHSALICKKYYKLKNNDIPVIHTGIDTSFFYPRKINKRKNLTIIFVGRLAEAKGIKILTRACCKLLTNFPNLKLKIIGEEHQKGIVNEIKKIEDSAKASKMLEFLGAIDRNKLPGILSNGDIFALPSYYEGGPGFAYLEAMACGLPVIGCRNGGMTEIIKNGKNGFLIPPRNVPALVTILRRLLNSRKFREKIGKNARKYVVENADTLHCIKELEKFYKTVIYKHKK